MQEAQEISPNFCPHRAGSPGRAGGAPVSGAGTSDPKQNRKGRALATGTDWLQPAPLPDLAVGLSFFLGSCHPLPGTRQSFQEGHPPCQRLFAQPQGLCLEVLEQALTWQPPRLHLPPAEAKPCGAEPLPRRCGRGLDPAAGTEPHGQSLQDDVGSGLRPATSCPRRKASVCELLRL